MTTTPIVALDTTDDRAALAIVDELGDLCRFYKVGSTLFTAAGTAVVGELRSRGVDVFLDLKFHDIPNTVRGAVASAVALGVRLITVHASGGEAMLRAAVDAAGDQRRCGILAVTVLTSLSAADIASAWGRDAERLIVADEVRRLASTAADACAYGVVCSGLEAGMVREAFGGRLATLVPGVRLAGGAAQDQARVVTPRAAARAGARYIVIGRPVTASSDPRAAMAEVLTDLG
jgi:orotidine-5'-phosphate decarboxylase